MIEVRSKGNFNKTESFLKQAQKASPEDVFDRYADRVLSALKKATPVDTGLTADSWIYKIERKKNSVRIAFYNTNVVDGMSVAVLVQYGHAARDGRWIPGIDYINPAVQPIFDEISNAAWKEVIKG